MIDPSRALRCICVGICLATACGSEPPPEDPPIVISAPQYDCRGPTRPAKRPTALPECMIDFGCDADLVVGHRGVGGGFSLFAPENSLSAFRLAILMGVDGIEIDVRHTLDDQLVVLHDGSLRRTTGVDEDVTTLLASDVAAVALSAEGYDGDFSCEHVPTFAEVLDLARDRVFLIVDTKTHRGDLVARAIQQADMLDGAVVSVSDVNTAVAARNAVPEVRVQIRPGTVAEYTTMAALFDRPAEIIEIPERQIGAFLPIAASVEGKVFVDIFGRDADAFGSGNLAQYNEPHAAGADIVQTEFPMWVLRAQGRRFWSDLAQPRDLGLDSPLLGD